MMIEKDDIVLTWTTTIRNAASWATAESIGFVSYFSQDIVEVLRQR